jgi:hypothetical protein
MDENLPSRPAGAMTHRFLYLNTASPAGDRTGTGLPQPAPSSRVAKEITRKLHDLRLTAINLLSMKILHAF